MKTRGETSTSLYPTWRDFQAEACIRFETAKSEDYARPLLDRSSRTEALETSGMSRKGSDLRLVLVHRPLPCLLRKGP